jgi:hypothetical protein
MKTEGIFVSDYQQFLERKQFKDIISGHDCSPENLNSNLFDFQRVIVAWAIKKGRAAIFADTGLGKTIMECAWAHEVYRHTHGNVIMFAPLCVALQTVQEAAKFGITVHYCRDQSQIKPGINITNYEMLDKFDLSQFAGVVLDESSILKAQDGKTRTALIESCQNVLYRLSCSATPSPNDHMELGNQSEFLGVMSMVEMLAMFFTHDGGETSKWRLKGHGRAKFWQWMATWAIVIRKPSDLGFNDAGYDLPPLNIIPHVISSKVLDGQLFAMPAAGLMERNQARRESIDDRVQACADIVNDSDEAWVIWCNLNDESDLLESSITNSKAVSGSDSLDQKESTIAAFSDGELPKLVSKPSITGYGMNWQHCHNTAFVGLSDSWESYYQAIRRFYRFGQKHPVNVHVFYAETEGAVVENILRKEQQNNEMAKEMVEHMRELTKAQIMGTKQEKTEYQREVYEGDGFTVHLADCVDLAGEIEDGSIDYTIFSPPFASLYTYSNSDRDMGNCKDDDEFMEQFQYLVHEMLRITRPGRLLSFHCMNLPTSKQNHGYIGIRDFRGELIRMFVEAGWIYHSEVCIWKDPVTAMQRTKALGLLHKTIRKDSSMSRQGIPDYLVTMRKPGDNDKPIAHTHEEFPVDLWQQYASPVWMDINPSNTLNKMPARDENDERHICPLQLDVIERAMELWTAPDDLVFSPFTGIGSEGYMALQKGRRFIGSELKPSYWKVAIENLKDAKKITADLFA